MGAQRIVVAILRGVTTIFKKLLAIAILCFARFINTDIGKWVLLGTLTGVIAGAYHFEHVALFPLGVRVASAGVRRGIMFAMIRVLTPRIRFKIYRYIDLIKRICKRKWGALTPIKRFLLQGTLVVIVGSLILDYFKFTHIVAHIAMVVPIPVFILVYATEKIPRLILTFAERQGVGKLVYDGGWHLLPSQLRKPLDACTDWVEAHLIAGRQKGQSLIEKRMHARKQKRAKKEFAKHHPASD